MIEELNGEPLHVCVCWSRKAPLHVAHCLELDLIGEGQTPLEARFSLKELIKIQCQVCEDNDLDLCPTDVHDRWRECHDHAQYTGKGDVVVVPSQINEGKSHILQLKIDNSKRCIYNRKGDSWPSERSLCDVESILRDNAIYFRRVSDKPQYGYFLGRWGAEGEGPLQSYPLYVPDGTHIRWYHLQGIALRFGLDGFRLRLVCDNENVES